MNRMLETATFVGERLETIGTILSRDGTRLARDLGLTHQEGYREAQGLLGHVMAISRAQVAARCREAIAPNLQAADGKA